MSFLLHLYDAYYLGADESQYIIYKKGNLIDQKIKDYRYRPVWFYTSLEVMLKSLAQKRTKVQGAGSLKELLLNHQKNIEILSEKLKEIKEIVPEGFKYNRK